MFLKLQTEFDLEILDANFQEFAVLCIIFRLLVPVLKRRFFSISQFSLKKNS
jgi:hypothetical protein